MVLVRSPLSQTATRWPTGPASDCNYCPPTRVVTPGPKEVKRVLSSHDPLVQADNPGLLPCPEGTAPLQLRSRPERVRSGWRAGPGQAGLPRQAAPQASAVMA